VLWCGGVEISSVSLPNCTSPDDQCRACAKSRCRIGVGVASRPSIAEESLHSSALGRYLS
jgi:hypothetical protein